MDSAIFFVCLFVQMPRHVTLLAKLSATLLRGPISELGGWGVNGGVGSGWKLRGGYGGVVLLDNDPSQFRGWLQQATVNQRQTKIYWYVLWCAGNKNASEEAYTLRV
jgi:hypothetical protein